MAAEPLAGATLDDLRDELAAMRGLLERLVATAEADAAVAAMWREMLNEQAAPDAGAEDLAELQWFYDLDTKSYLVVEGGQQRKANAREDAYLRSRDRTGKRRR